MSAAVVAYIRHLEEDLAAARAELRLLADLRDLEAIERDELAAELETLRRRPPHRSPRRPAVRKAGAA